MSASGISFRTVEVIDPSRARKARRGRRAHLGLVRAGLLALGLGCGTAGAWAEEPPEPFALACAQADLHLITLIERHGELQDVAPTELTRAAFIMMEARKACAEGRGADGLALYGSVFLRATRLWSD